MPAKYRVGWQWSHRESQVYIESRTYEAGDLKAVSFGSQMPQNMVFEFHFGLAGMFNAIAAATITRYVEFWCQDNCTGQWSVCETERTLTVSFEHIRDVVLFMFSDEYGAFAAMPESILKAPRLGAHHEPSTTSVMRFMTA